VVIKKISILGYKNIKEKIEIDFTVDKMSNGSSDFDNLDIYNDSIKVEGKWYKLISSIIGPNASGKTSILSAINDGLKFINDKSISNFLLDKLFKAYLLIFQSKKMQIKNIEEMKIDELQNLWINNFKSIISEYTSNLLNVNSDVAIIKIKTINDKQYTTAIGKSKKLAQQAAAKIVLEQLKGK